MTAFIPSTSSVIGDVTGICEVVLKALPSVIVKPFKFCMGVWLERFSNLKREYTLF
jgi:hypothetical protein